MKLPSQNPIGYAEDNDAVERVEGRLNGFTVHIDEEASAADVVGLIACLQEVDRLDVEARCKHAHINPRVRVTTEETNE